MPFENKPNDSVWTNLFKFPFLDVPLQIMMGISCPSMEYCYVTGGHPNTGFGIYIINNKDWSTATKQDISSPEPAIFLLSIAM